MQSYTRRRFQRASVNGSRISWSNIMIRFPQIYILGLLWFNFFLYDVSIFNNDSNRLTYVNDKTLAYNKKLTSNEISRLISSILQKQF